MATVFYQGISEYASRAADDMNDVLDAFVTASTALSADNFRDEGFDEGCLYANAVAGAPDFIDYSGPDEVFANTGPSVITFTAPSRVMRLDNGGLGWGLVATEHLRIRFGTELYLLNGITESETLLFQIAYRRGGVTTVETLSRQWFKGDRFIFGNNGAQPPGTGEVDYLRDATQLTWLLEGTGTPIEWVEVQSAVTAGNYTLSKTSLQAIAFYR